MDELKTFSARILIVDDEPANVKLLEMMLELAGYDDFRSTTDPRDALPLFREYHPDVVLLDLSMPHLDGFEVMRQLQGFIPQDTFLPILVLTAMVGMEIKRKALASGASDFLTKPFDNLEVLLRVKNLLQSRQLHMQMQRHNEELEVAVQERTIELREALIELRGTQQQVIRQERMHALAVMAGGVAHDLNNALAVVLGFSEIVLRDCQEVPALAEDKQAMEAIITAAEDAAQMVRRLGEFTRPESDSVRQPVDLNALVKQAVVLTEPRWRTQAFAAGADIEVRTETSAVSVISADPAELREALTNLIFNAVDAMPDGGTITLRTRQEDEKVTLEVSDTGTGMDEDVRERCLEPFYTTKGEKGTGLGLAVVYGIAQRHGATMEISSEPGVGTTFIFQLPVFQDSTPRAVETLPEGVSQLLRVLVVDDQAFLREIIRQYLSQDWHEVETAASGPEALEKFEAGEFDLVITDQAMPEQPGNQLVAVIKERAPHQRVIMLTGFGAGDDVREVTGADAILAKPVSREALRRGIAEVMQSTKPHAKPAQRAASTSAPLFSGS